MDTAAGTGARFQFASDQSLLVYFDSPSKEDRPKHRSQESPVTLQANEKVRKLLRLLELEPIAGVRNLHPAYCSLLVKFDAAKWRHEKLEQELRKYLVRLYRVRLPEPQQVEIPVCYGGEFGPDLEDVASTHGIRPQRVIELHS